MSSSPTRGNEPGDLSVALGPKTSSPMLQEVLFYIFFSYFNFNMHHPTPLVLLKLENPKPNSPFLTSLQIVCTKKTHPCVQP